MVVSHLCTYPVVEHSNDAGALGVGYGVKDLLHLRRGTNRNLNKHKERNPKNNVLNTVH